jgi:DNA-binding transcriptional regulator YdaS (Cro superfamily)
MPEYDDGLRAAINAAGGESPFAAALGIVVQSLRDWKRVPPHRVLQVEKITGIDREKLRPDLYPPGPRRRRK